MKQTIKKYNLLLWLFFMVLPSFAQNRVGWCMKNGDNVVMENGQLPFAMHSVMKFPQALYVAHFLDSIGTSLDQKVLVKKKGLMTNTWSPMLETFDKEKEFSYRELLALSLQQSDNNACDLLFHFCGAPSKVQHYLKSLGFNNILINRTEKEMRHKPRLSCENWCTPSSIVELLEWFYAHHNENEYLQYIWDLMLNCNTGQERIQAALPQGAKLVHKTGTGPRDKKSSYDANDVGIILMPNGEHYSIAIFMKNAKKEDEIADIVKSFLE